MVPGIDVQIGIEFLKRDIETAAFEQAADGRRRNSFPEGGNHAAGDKNVFSHLASPFPLTHPPMASASNNFATRSRSSGVSTPRDSYSVSTTRI